MHACLYISMYACVRNITQRVYDKPEDNPMNSPFFYNGTGFKQHLS